MSQAELYTGADALMHTLEAAGVEMCFANPGTSEMQLVTALDRTPGVRPVLALFEGVVTGAADGYGRMAGKPAATLLHLGPGVGNGMANLHNARRARSPIVNLVGDHATDHLKLDAPLTSDIAALAGTVSGWVRTAQTADQAVPLAAEAVAAAHQGQSATLILPADTMWADSPGVGQPVATPQPKPVASATIEAVAKAIKGAKAPMILLNGHSTQDDGLAAAARLNAVGVRVMCDGFVGRLSRGAGRFAPDRMKYFSEQAVEDLAGTDLLVLCETVPPVSFFAYPGKPSVLTPEGAEVMTLADVGADGPQALADLAEALGAPKSVDIPRQDLSGPGPKWNAATVGQVLAQHLPEGAVISDDAVTAGMPCYMTTQHAAPHEWLMLTGGAIGQGLPVALGAALACPDRKVVALTGDGAGMYMPQTLWSMAREQADVLTIVFANHAYRILNIELGRTGAGEPGPAAEALLQIDNPRMDWLKIAEGFGLEASRAHDAASLDAQIQSAMAKKGPRLIEVALG